MLWVEFVFMMLVLKLPVLYVAWLVWWAVKQEPRPLEGAAVLPDPSDPSPRGWWQSRLRRLGPRPPHGRPARTYQRVARASAARASTLDRKGRR